MSLILGLDVGTATGAAATKNGGRVQPCPLGRSTATVPAVVVLHDDGSAVLGEDAEHIAGLELPRTARELRNDPASQALSITIGGQAQAPYEMLRTLYQAVLQRVTEAHGSAPSHTVLTHPALPENVRCAMLERVADELVPGAVLVPDPVAATVKLACDGVLPADCVVAVYDLGGGTFDATLVRRAGDQFSVLGEPGGLADFGGIDVDDLVLAHVDRSLGGALGRLDLADPDALAAYSRLRAECRDAKERLSYDTEVTLDASLPGAPALVRLTRTELDAMVMPRLETTLEVLGATIRQAGLQPGDVDAIALVGGSTRSPAVVDLLTARTSVQVLVDPYPELTVALGAAQMVDEHANRASVFPVALTSNLARAVDALHDGTTAGPEARTPSDGNGTASALGMAGVSTAVADPPASDSGAGAGAGAGTGAGAGGGAGSTGGAIPIGDPAGSETTDPDWSGLAGYGGAADSGESKASKAARRTGPRRAVADTAESEAMRGRVLALVCLLVLLAVAGVLAMLLGRNSDEGDPASASSGYGDGVETSSGDDGRDGGSDDDGSSSSSSSSDNSSSSSSPAEDRPTIDTDGDGTPDATLPPGSSDTTGGGSSATTVRPPWTPPNSGTSTSNTTSPPTSNTTSPPTSDTTSPPTSDTTSPPTSDTTAPASTTSSSSFTSPSSTSEVTPDLEPTLRTEGGEG